MCSGKTLLSSRLLAVFSYKWGYELVSLPGHRSSSSSTTQAWGLGSSFPLSQVVPWLNRATGFALGVISSAYLPLGLSIAGLYSKFQVFSQLFLSGGARVMLCNKWAMTQLSGLGGTEWAHCRQLPNFPKQSFWCGVCGGESHALSRQGRLSSPACVCTAQAPEPAQPI